MIGDDIDHGRRRLTFVIVLGIYHLYAFNGLSMISLYRETKNKKYLKLAKTFASKIKSWANSEVSVIYGSMAGHTRGVISASHAPLLAFRIPM
jgi:uncharacterized protein YyaL (SSP411 family)